MDSNSIDRRTLIGVSAAAAAVLAAGSAAAQQPPAAPAPGHVMGVFGKAGAGPGRPVIAMLVHPKMVLQDLVGPMTVFNLMMSEIHLVWKSLDPVMTEIGVPITPSTTFADCPRDVDVLFVPGGLAGSIAMMQDDAVLAFLADTGARAKYVTSVCTGSLVLGAAGLLRGYKATSLWNVRDLLPLMGATLEKKRVVHDRNRLTGGGVTAGIDFGLTLCALLNGEDNAKLIQLIIEYAPEPPFNAGEPETAPPEIVERLLKARAGVTEQAATIAKARAARWM
ncbi:DJ-1/PfpI family protein [Sphingosinicella soli]|uniref:Cyclohexyl-isocyanide hydratase n=1 Tax=Sphingosinicella soli TaxID=333708 RepID=A0A7W7AZH4_9SPHN|nr:DJ-1/PfpI family protein [Sphingosinicella soli]MBB4631079.1 cyclohexyl-isocyanide hydratase [Sphingosinicella soli]